MTKVRYAVVGLGWIARSAVLPAFANTRRNSTLTALVSGDARKLARVGREYGVTDLATYDDYDRLLASGAVDAVYIALPNTMHREFTERAAKQGIHVLCEKPLARSTADARAMVKACRRAGVKLMTSYRLHYEPATLAAIAVARNGIGQARSLTSTFAFTVKEPNIRLDERGGGPLFDIGIYCINAARHFFAAEPLEVQASIVQGGVARFRGVEQSATAVLRFPGGRLASFTCSFDSHADMTLRVTGTRGRMELEPAYAIDAAKTLVTTRTGTRTTKRFPATHQFAAVLAHFSDCIQRNREPDSPGEEGLRDIEVIEALYRSARTGRKVSMA